MRNLDVLDNDGRSRSNSSLVSRANRSRSNSFKPLYDESGRPTNLMPIPSNLGKTEYSDVSQPSNINNSIHKASDLDVTKSSLSVIDQEIKPVNHKSHEDSGFFSSILHMAHNTANIMSHKDKDKSGDEKDVSPMSLEVHSNAGGDDYSGSGSRLEHSDAKSTFSNKLDSLIHDQTINGSEVSPMVTSSRLSNSDLAGLIPSSPNPDSESTQLLSPTNVQFNSVKESPVNTLGEGNLTLNDFKESRRDSLERLSRLESKTSSDNKSKRKSFIEVEMDSDDAHSHEPKLKYASKKRNREFHQIFKKVPKSDRLIDDFSCALSKDILVQGRMYLSTNFICFKSNILGWVTNLLIPLQEVVQIEKRSTAVLFPNGMIIKTLYQKYTFATFISRDTTFDLLTRVWHRVLLEKDGSADYAGSTYEEESETESDDDSDENEDEEYDSDAEKQLMNGDDDGDGNVLEDDEDGGPLDEDSNDTSISSTSPPDEDEGHVKDVNGQPKGNLIPDGISDSNGDSFKGLPIVGPLTHDSTASGYEKAPNDTFIVEDEFKAPLGVVFSLLFGKDTSYFVKILKNQKNFDIEEGKITGIEKQGDQRNYKYIKPLGGSIGPKQTTCVITDKILRYDLDSCILIEQSTSTPDVPSGNSFKVRTSIYLYWGANNYTKMYVVTNIEWTGKSWIKGPIEKGSIEGQKDSMKTLIENVNDFISAGGNAKNKRPRKKSMKKSGSRSRVETLPTEQPVVEPNKSLIDKLNDVAETVGGLIPIPMISSSIVGYIAMGFQLLLVIHIYNWIFRSGGNLKVSSIDNSINLNGGKFFLIPSIENNLNNKDTVLANEVGLWDWINDKADMRLRVPSESYIRDYNHQELTEISKLTQMKLDELNRLLNHHSK